MDEIAPEQAGWMGDGVSSQEGRKQREDGPSGGGSGEGVSEGVGATQGRRRLEITVEEEVNDREHFTQTGA